VRKSYHILSLLAYSANDTLTLSMRDGVHMTLQKQVTNTSDRYFKFIYCVISNVIDE